MKALIRAVVHALRSIREPPCSARLSAKPHANLIGLAQCSVIAIFALRRIGEPITVTAKEVPPGSIKLGHPATADDPIDDARADEIGPRTAETARHPDNLRRLLDKETRGPTQLFARTVALFVRHLPVVLPRNLRI